MRLIARKYGILDVNIPINLVCAFFGSTIPTSSFNFQFFFILVV